MAAETEQYKIFSDKKIEAADENMKTADCLRGRLLAERQASRAAKDESDLIGNKLIELENRLREETKLRNKAEKKLQFFIKKLQSLQIKYDFEQSESSISLESSTLSFKSSNGSCSSTSSPQIQKPEPKTPNLESSNSNSSSVCEPDPDPDANTKESDSSEVNNGCDESIPSFEDSKPDGNSFSSSLKNSSTNESTDNEEDSFVDNSLAIVPVSLPPTTTTTVTPRSEPETVDKNVGEALNALRLARERIQFCIERRHMIRVGPS